jgi:hypothetical protein
MSALCQEETCSPSVCAALFQPKVNSIALHRGGGATGLNGKRGRSRSPASGGGAGETTGRLHTTDLRRND